MTSSCLEAVTGELDRFSVPYKVEATRKHIHVRYGQDLENLHVVASTPSDWRAPKNERAQIRRDLVALGLTDQEIEPSREVVPIQLVEGEPVCFSQDVAESFGKAHKDVLRAIDRVRSECGAEFDQRNFAPIEYVDAKGRRYRAFRLTQDGFSLVVMGFTGAKATEWKVRYIDAFRAMHSELARLSSAPEALSSIRCEMEAVVSLVAELETRIPVLPVPHQQPRRRLSLIERRKLRRELHRRSA